MKIEWLHEARMEYRDLLLYHKNMVGKQSAAKFADNILSSVKSWRLFQRWAF